MSDNDELIQQFIAVSGVDAERAKFFLEAAAWELSTALSSFFEDGGEGNAEESSASGSAAVSVPEAMDDAPPPKKTGKPPAWLSHDSDSDEDEEGEAFYAGGSQHSGQQVLGPPRSKKDVVAKLFKAAQQHGAEVISDKKGGPKTVKKSFKGTSYRLGETPDDTEVIPDVAGGSQSPTQAVELRMWRTGFTVNDGPLRDYEEEDNKRFLEDIRNGRIPLELVRASNGREVAINMSDHHHEDYTPSKPVRKAFTGAGQTLGSPAPSVIGQVTHLPGPGGSANKPPADPKVQEEEAKKNLAVDASQPATNVQVRLTDGSRLVIRANQSHTVDDLRRYVITARPEYGFQQFALMTTFPHAELAQPEQSLVDAKLLNAAIVLKTK